MTQPFAFDSTILQAVQEPQQRSIALALPDAAAAQLDAARRTRLVLEAAGHSHEVFFHGSMSAWARYDRYFGASARAALEQEPGIEAHFESALIAAATKVPGETAWLRVRACTPASSRHEELLGLPPGTPVAVRGASCDANTAFQAPRLKAGELRAQVLTSHAHGLVLNLDAPGLRKLKGQPGDWYTLQLGGESGQALPIVARRGMSFEREAEVWALPQALLFDYESHWDDDRVTVMVLRPMQQNWRGRFPDGPSVTMPVVDPGSTVAIRLAGAQL
jgi:hypothetical protein